MKDAALAKRTSLRLREALGPLCKQLRAAARSLVQAAARRGGAAAARTAVQAAARRGGLQAVGGKAGGALPAAAAARSRPGTEAAR